MCSNSNMTALPGRLWLSKQQAVCYPLSKGWQAHREGWNYFDNSTRTIGDGIIKVEDTEDRS